MLLVVLGMPHSGKSLWAESVMLKRNRQLTYVGTLPYIPSFSTTISRHRARRPPAWSLLEFEGDFEKDMNALLKQIRNKEDVLLDGLSFYLLRCHALYGNRFFTEFRKAAPLLKESASSDCHIMVVDSPIAPFLKRMERCLLLLAHRAILRSAKQLWIYRDNEAIPFTSRSAIQWSSTATMICHSDNT